MLATKYKFIFTLQVRLSNAFLGVSLIELITTHVYGWLAAMLRAFCASSYCILR